MDLRDPVWDSKIDLFGMKIPGAVPRDLNSLFRVGLLGCSLRALSSLLRLVHGFEYVLRAAICGVYACACMLITDELFLLSSSEYLFMIDARSIYTDFRPR